MTIHLTYETSVEVDNELAYAYADVEVDYTFYPGQRERGPTFSCGGEPAEHPTAEIYTIRYRPKGIDKWVPMPNEVAEFLGFNEDTQHMQDALVEHAVNQGEE